MTAATDLLALYDRALPEVYGYLVRRCDSAATAEDLTADTFMAAVRAVQADAGKQIEIGWLIGTARHKLIDHWRRSGRQRDALAELWDDHVDQRRSVRHSRSTSRPRTPRWPRWPRSTAACSPCATATACPSAPSPTPSDAPSTPPRPCSPGPRRRSAPTTSSTTTLPAGRHGDPARPDRPVRGPAPRRRPGHAASRVRRRAARPARR